MVIFLAEEALWTTRADGRVRLRLEPFCTQRPYTVHQMFYEALDKYGNLSALGFKRKDKWERISYYQYYLIARKVAKGFLKVGAHHSTSLPLPPTPEEPITLHPFPLPPPQPLTYFLALALKGLLPNSPSGKVPRNHHCKV